MNTRSIVLSLCAALLLAGCQKKKTQVTAAPPPKPAAVEMVKESERSRHFAAVSQQLELGGTLYGYMDVDGDVLKIGGLLNEVLGKMAETQPAQAPFLKQDYAALFSGLGLADIKAVGFSSVPDGTGFFRNRSYFHIPGQRHGLLAGFGGAPAPFARLGLAPADADFYSEAEIDLPVVYATVRELLAKVSGEKAVEGVEAKLKRTGENAAFSLYSFIQGLKGRTALVLRLDPEKELRLPGTKGQMLVVPALSLLICLDGVAPTVEEALVKSAQFTATVDGAVHLYELKQPLPLPGIKPVLAVDGTSLYFATSMEFMRECRGVGPAGLAQRAEFKEALAHVGSEGNALSYVSPRFFEQVKRIEALNPKLPPESKRVLEFVLHMLPKTERPLVTVRRNLPDGILVNSYWNRSLKQDVAALAIYNPMTVGMMAAMAIPAFQKVRTASQEKVVLNNLRQLSAAADQHYLENGVTTARYDDLVGPGKYIKQMNPVGGEDYRLLLFKQGAPLRVRVPSLKKTVEYAP